MTALILFFIIWIPLSSILYTSLRSYGQPIRNPAKKALFWFISLPLVWLFVLNEFTEKYLLKKSLLVKVVNWFQK